MNIKEFEKGESCFGPILSVDGVDYQDLKREDVVEFINYMFKENINNGLLIRECFETCLDYLQAEQVESSSSSCEQCGNWNHYAKYIVDDEDNN